MTLINDYVLEVSEVFLVPDNATNGSEGDSVYVKGPDGTEWLYMHMWCGSVQVKEGQHVKAGDVLGYMGNTGDTRGTTGVHLHLQHSYSPSIDSNWTIPIVLKANGLPLGEWKKYVK